ncbi:MAG: hypothetical protein QOE91_1267, partial [Gaiellaceae bacterium]|nr:hypothetical protein [Gaiellaceae bacterium]
KDAVSVATRTPAGTVTQAIAYTGELFRATGQVTIDLLGFVTGHVGFTFETKTVNVHDTTHGIDATGASLALITLTVNDLFVGIPGGIGLQVASGTLSIASLKADTRSWVAVSAQLSGGSFVGVTGLTLTIESLAVSINRGTGAAALDWAHSLDLDRNGTFGDAVVLEDVAHGTHTIAYTGDVSLSATGSATVDLFGLVTGHISFVFETRTVDVHDGALNLTGAGLTTLQLTVDSLFLGVNGVGFSINTGTVAIAVLRPAAATDTRKWTAISSNISGATLTGVPGINLTAQSLRIEISQASLGATPLNWATAIGGAPLHVGSVTLDFSGSLLRLEATATLEIGQFVYASGTFVFEKGDDLFVTPAGAAATVRVSLLKIGVSGGTVFAGVGPVTSPTRLGVSLTNVSFGLALMREVGVGTTRSYFALSGSGAAALVGIDGFTLIGSLNVAINSATNSAPIDFTRLPGGKLTIATGPTSSVDLAFTGSVLKVTGSIALAIDGFAYVSGDFGFEQGSLEDVTLENGMTGKATFLKIGASNATAFFGVNGPAAATGAMGLSITGVSFALALATPTAALATASGSTSFFALKATGSVALIGITGLTASIQSATVEINQARGATPHAIDFSAHPVVVATGPTSTLTLDFDRALFRASGSVAIEVGGFVYLNGTVAFEKGLPLDAQPLSTNGTSIGTANLTALTIGASNVNAFVGNGFVDANHDGVLDANSAAIGLSLTGVSFAIALIKPTAVGSTRSYFALQAHADHVELVGIAGFTFDVSNLSVEVNSSSDSAAAAGTVLPTVDFSTKHLEVQTGAPDPEIFTFSGQLLRASGRVDIGIAGVTVGADFFFEQTTRPDGTKVIKLAVGDLSFKLGDPNDPSFEMHTGDPVAPGMQVQNGLLFITPQGLAGQFTLRGIHFGVGNSSFGVAFTTDLQIAFNSSTQIVDETFNIPDPDVPGSTTTRLQVAAGKYFRITASDATLDVTVDGTKYSLGGNFQIEQLTVGTAKQVRLAFSNVHAGGTGSPISITDGTGAILLLPGGSAGLISAKASADFGAFKSGA